MSSTTREEFEKLVRKQSQAAHAKTAASNAVQALREFVRAAEKLSNQWEDELNEGYPEGLPNFDDLVDQLDTWRRKVERSA